VDAGLDSAAIEPATAETLALDLAGNPRISGAAVDIGAYETVFHVCDINLDGAVSKADVVLISQALRSTVDAGTYGDIDNDGRITSQDTRGCALRCTLARCAEPTP
jgi:hypothetical protein